MNWYIIFANDNKINDLLLYFNNHPEMTAFVPKIEKLMKKMERRYLQKCRCFLIISLLKVNLIHRSFIRLLKV